MIEDPYQNRIYEIGRPIALMVDGIWRSDWFIGAWASFAAVWNLIFSVKFDT